MKSVQLLAVLLVISSVSAAKLRRRPPTRAKPATLRPFQDEWDPQQMCYDDLELWRLADYECDQYWECQDDGSALLFQCDPGEIFDYEFLDCFEDALCWDQEPQEDECPLNSNDVITFTDLENCGQYYICINGQPTLRSCRQGQHWNQAMQYCDNPGSAGCDVSCALKLKFRVKN